LEAGFLILLAFVLAFAELEPLLIVVIMGLAWVLVSLIEYFAWRQGPRFPTRYAAAVGPSLEQDKLAEGSATAAPPLPPRSASSAPIEEETMVEAAPVEQGPAAGSAEESVEQAGARVDAARLAFTEEERRTRHRLEPLQPRPRRRYGLFGPRVRPGEGSREEER
jgi:predicted lipid-binding transport protein (Tim44 family)